MINTPVKKRAPLSQLRSTAQQIFKMLKEKKIVHETNILEELARDAKAPILPGIPSYLPHKWTIQAAQEEMYILVKDWVRKTNHNLDLQENASEFFKFVVKRMQQVERKFKLEMNSTKKMMKEMKEAPLLSDIFSPMRKRQTTRGMHKFFVDSFAISVIVKSNGSTGDYAEWFLNNWTPALYKLWCRQNNDVKINSNK